MKYKVLFRIALALIVTLFSSYMAGDREEAFYCSNKHLLIQQDKCFSKFLSELKSLEALLFIPEEKVSQAKKYDIHLSSGDKAMKRNMDFSEKSSSYVQMQPSTSGTSECGKSIALNFNNLEMTVFVREENLRESQDILQFKYFRGAPLSSEMVKFDTKTAETLQIKGERGAWQNYVPVEL